MTRKVQWLTVDSRTMTPTRTWIGVGMMLGSVIPTKDGQRYVPHETDYAPQV